MNELALFAGIGGGILAGHLLGWRTVCAVELDAYAASVLCARQNDGLLPPFPVWDDIRTFDGRPWRGIVDVVSGGFPCQDISIAGAGAGIEGERSGLWSEMARIIREVRPRFVFVENSPALVSRGLGAVLGDLAALGYDAEWGVLGAAAVGAPHLRERIWILAAHLDSAWKLQPERRVCTERRRAGDSTETPADADRAGQRQQWGPFAAAKKHASTECGGWWAIEPGVVRMAHGIPARVDRIRGLGNAQVPQCAAEAFQQLNERLGR